MTLHETVETMKKLGIGSAIGIGLIIVLVITFNVGVLMKNILFPPKAEDATHPYGKLQALVFPQNATKANLVYDNNNLLSGKFDVFPDRLNVYKLDNPAPNFLNLDKAKDKAKTLQFIDDSGVALPEVPLGDATYEWDEPGGLQRKLMFNIVSFDFTLTSNYLTSLTVLNATGLPDEPGAIKTATDMLGSVLLMPNDIDVSKTQSTDKKVNYYTYPQTLSIKNSQLVPASSLSDAQVIRVDLYQNDVKYNLNTGFKSDNSLFQTKEVKLPILYPHPPYSTMSLWIGVGPQGPTVVNAKFSHRNYIVEKDAEPTYLIKTADEAFEELKKGAGYIAAYNGSDIDVEEHINNAYLAYYIGDTEQQYLMPVYVFEGDKGFFGYVSAVRNEWVE
jgi:hypothetical protein